MQRDQNPRRPRKRVKTPTLKMQLANDYPETTLARKAYCNTRAMRKGYAMRSDTSYKRGFSGLPRPESDSLSSIGAFTGIFLAARAMSGLRLRGRGGEDDKSRGPIRSTSSTGREQVDTKSEIDDCDSNRPRNEDMHWGQDT
jgi:hypothetical protein